MGDLIGWVIDLLMSTISWLFEDVARVIFRFLFEWAYRLVIATPLQVVNILVFAFRYFCNGIASSIFDTTYNSSTGTISYNFSWSSSLGFVILFIFIISMIMFFTQFLLTFATRTQIDQSGNPISNQAKRLKYLKWPIIMVLFLLLGPVVLVIIDTFMGILIGVFENPNSGGAFNYQHVVSTSVIHQRMSEIKTLSTTVLLNDLQSVRTYLNQLDNYYSLLQETIFSAKNVDQIDLNILKSTIGNDDLYKILTTNSMGILPRYISSAIAAINKVEEYIRVDMQDDINRFQQIIPNIRINEYISSSDATKLTAIRSNLIQLFNESQKIGTNIANLTKTSPSVQSGWSAYNLPRAYWSLIVVAAGNMNASADISDAGIIFANNLSDLAIRSQNYEDATIVRLAFTTLNNKLINPDYVFLQNFDNSRSSSLYRIIYGDGTYCGLGGLIGRTKGSGLSSSIPATIYSAISGDTNGENWTTLVNDYFINNASFIQWIFGVFTCFGMISITYTFCQAAIKRTYYLIAYWMLGFVYLANGISNEKVVKDWLKMFIGKWWCILLLYLLFEFVSILFPIIQPTILEGLSEWSFSSFGGIAILPMIGVIFAIEQAYSVVYAIWNKYEGGFGAAEEQFQPQQSFMMTEGAKTYEKTWQSIKEFPTLIFKPVDVVTNVLGDVTKYVDSIHKFWDRRKASQKNSYDAAKRKMENRTIDSKKKLFSQSRDQEKMINKMKEVADGAKKVGTTGRDVANQLGRAIASAKSATSAHTSAGVIDEGLAAGYDPDY